MCYPSNSSSSFSTEQGVPQGSPLSPDFLLFYADLVDVCNSLDLHPTGIGFFNDVNDFDFGKNTQKTCSAQKNIHCRCFTWEVKHSASFAPNTHTFVRLLKLK
jgi:hypothetical protein